MNAGPSCAIATSKALQLAIGEVGIGRTPGERVEDPPLATVTPRDRYPGIARWGESRKRNRGELGDHRPSDEPSEDRLSGLMGIAWQAERCV